MNLTGVSIAWNRSWLLLPMILVTAAALHADAAFLLQQPYGTFGTFNPTGHAAIYLSRVCADSPTVLRRCKAGEPGAVISRYNRIAGHDWIAIPLIPYLYGVERPDEVPLSINPAGVASIRDQYRRKHLQEIAPDAPGAQAPEGDWTQLVGAAYDRKIYGFMIETDESADDALIEYLNLSPNKGRFNLLIRNCADFTRTIINFYYPKAARRSIVADAGITTPKQVAKSLVRFSKRRPELQFYSFVIPQIPGSRGRSKPARGVFESLIRSKKYAAPLLLAYPWVAAGGAAAYLTRGRFDPSKHATLTCEPGQLVEGIRATRADSGCGSGPAERVEAAAGPIISDPIP